MKKMVGSTLELSSKVFFSFDKYQLKIWVENTAFAIQHIGNRKSFTEAPPPPPTPPLPVTKLFLLHTIVVLLFTLHIKLALLVKGGEECCQNAQKQCNIKKTY